MGLESAIALSSPVPRSISERDTFFKGFYIIIRQPAFSCLHGNQFPVVKGYAESLGSFQPDFPASASIFPCDGNDHMFGWIFWCIGNFFFVFGFFPCCSFRVH